MGQETKQKTKKIFFLSLKYKFLITQLLLFVISLSSFLYYTIGLYLDDKRAYIYESSVSHIESQSNFIEKFLESEVSSSELLFNMLSLYDEEFDQRDRLERYSSKNDNFLDLTFFHFNEESVRFDEGFYYFNKKISKIYKKSQEVSKRHKFLFSELHDFYKTSKLSYFKIINDEGVIPHLYIAIRSKRKNGVYIFRFLFENMASNVFQSSSFTDFITDRKGKVLIHSRPEQVNESFYKIYSTFFTDIINSKSKSGVITVKKPFEGEYLVSYKINNQFNIIFFSEISRTKAFEFTKLIIIKTIVFGIFIGIAILIISLIFTQTITFPLDNLMKRTKSMSQGDFKSTVTVRSRDEIQLLAESFNYMTGRMDSILEEVKDKGRMESELQTAKIVQDSLFPNGQLIKDQYELFGHYQSASECGGDWWGYREYRDKLYLFIGDATGHGVPAALVTASACSCCQTILEYIEHFEGDYARPADILKFLNSVVLLTGGQEILMTFFVAVYDSKEKTLEYSNASHNFPIIYEYAEKGPDKRSIKALGKAVGRRLGDKYDSEYSNETIKVSDNDVLLLYTDGPIEAVNPENKIWGERKFNKSFFTRAKLDSETIVKGILKDAFSYFDGVPPDDDVTLVAAKFTQKNPRG